MHLSGELMTQDIKIKSKSGSFKGIPIIDVEFQDKWAKLDPQTRSDVTLEIQNELIPKIEAHIESRGNDYKRGEKNKITDEFFAQSSVIQKWRDTMPTAEALYPLQKPENQQLADGTPFDEVAERYFPHALDGEGLRSRAAIMSYVMFEKFKEHDDERSLKWASLACGAAIPVYDAAQKLTKKGIDISINLTDIDGNALKFAKQLANDEYELGQAISTEKRNILRLKKLVKAMGENEWDAIDILGFFEYLPADDWSYKKHGLKLTMPGAIKFLGAAYSLLKPGGLLVLGNMRDSHSQLKFATQVVQWPYIRPRSIDRVTEIIELAGVDRSNITYYQAGDGVYTVAALSK
jgi:SAM-dependent methyltransferase